MTENRVIKLKSRPVELPSADHFEIVTEAMPTPGAGRALIQNAYAALSPWQGQRLKDFRNYTKPFEIGEVIDGDMMGRVVASNTADLAVGDMVVGRTGWRKFALTTPGAVEVLPTGRDAVTALATLSSPGLTAYAGLAAAKRGMAGETLVVTSAAGGVGSHAVQLGKLAGMRVIGLAGGPEKCAVVREKLGADVAVDYKAPGYEAALAAALPDGFDLFFDTVGGALGDVIFEHTAKFATIVLVGRTAANNSVNPGSDMVNVRVPWGQNAMVIGFNRYDRPEEWAAARVRMDRMAASGKIESLVSWATGFDAIPGALGGMLAGQHVGKTLVRFGDAS
jgi:NADPH-dependent curcumin reductase CurA